ncbi:MAG: type II secretion system F family protein [Lachnospiraceae bacterium]|nr:type II secretion system F family protein [Lachnospiraceae bacterium]
MKKTELNNREIATFCQETAMIFQAGITPVEGMQLLISDAHSSEAKQIYQEIYDVCSRGETFYSGVCATGVFPEYVLHMIDLGESSGNLDDVMQSLADYYEREETIAAGIRDAIRYPLIMTLMMLVVIYILLSRVLPIFQEVFEQLGSSMSGVSAGLLQVGRNFDRYALVLLLILLALFCLYFFASRSEQGRKKLNSLLSRISFTKSFQEDVAAARFASGMAVALSSGLDTYHSLDLAYNLMGSGIFSEKVKRCKDALAGGASFSEALSEAAIFSNFYNKMISIGWKTGAGDTVMRKIAVDYDNRATQKLQSMISVIEPTLVIILSLVIGMVLLSVILPLLGIMSSIG